MDISRVIRQHTLTACVQVVCKHCIITNTKTSYLAIAKATGTFSGGKELAEALGEIMREDVKEGRPLSCSVVVRTDTGRPGKGYFDCARDLGLNCPNDPAGEEAFWQAQITALGLVP